MLGQLQDQLIREWSFLAEQRHDALVLPDHPLRLRQHLWAAMGFDGRINHCFGCARIIRRSSSRRSQQISACQH